MKNLLKTLAVSAAAVAALGSFGNASAAVICNGCSYVDPVPGLTPAPNVNFANNLGTHNPLTGDNSTFNHGGLGNGSFTDWWVFTVNPLGLAGVNAIFLPTFGVQGFTVELYSVSSSTCAANGPTTVGQCTAVTLTNPLLPIITVGGVAPMPFVLDIPLMQMEGTYAFKITGTSVNAQGASNSYTGNITTRALPEPGTLALAALALLGAGAAARRRA